MQISPVSPWAPLAGSMRSIDVPRQRPPHRTGLHRLPRRVADLRGRLRLPVAVTNGQAPRASHLLDDLGVERLAGAEHLAKRRLPRAQILLDEHPPHRRWRAEARHRASRQRVEQASRRKAGGVEDQHGRLGVPGREDVAPRVLRPARRRDVEVHVTRLQPDPVHRREMPDRVADMRVLDELWLRGRPGCEVQEQRVGRGVGPSGRILFRPARKSS